MSQWISDSVNRLRESDTLVRNSWQHAEYSYFPNETVAAAAVDEAADAPDKNAAVERGDEGPLLAAVGEDASGEDSNDSSSSDDANVAPPPPLPPAFLAHPQELPHQAPRRDPGWDNTDDSNYEPGSTLESDSN